MSVDYAGYIGRNDTVEEQIGCGARKRDEDKERGFWAVSRPHADQI